MKCDADFEVNYDYDLEVDALFIYIDKDYQYETSIELDNEIMLDFDKTGVPVALEILNASKNLNISKNDLNNIQMIHISVEVDEKSINLEACFGVLIHNKKQLHSMNTFTSNDIGIPNIETELATV